jgi:hypothetical protein
MEDKADGIPDAEATRRPPRVLLAEDDLAFRMLLWAAFRSWGFEVLERRVAFQR